MLTRVTLALLAVLITRLARPHTGADRHRVRRGVG